MKFEQYFSCVTHALYRLEEDIQHQVDQGTPLSVERGLVSQVRQTIAALHAVQKRMRRKDNIRRWDRVVRAAARQADALAETFYGHVFQGVYSARYRGRQQAVMNILTTKMMEERGNRLHSCYPKIMGADYDVAGLPPDPAVVHIRDNSGLEILAKHLVESLVQI